MVNMVQRIDIICLLEVVKLLKLHLLDTEMYSNSIQLTMINNLSNLPTIHLTKKKI